MRKLLLQQRSDEGAFFWQKRFRSCSNTCAKGSLPRRPRPGPVEPRARRFHDISPPRSGGRSGSAIQAVAPMSRKAAGAATRKSSSNSITRKRGHGRIRTRSMESRCAAAHTISTVHARTSAKNTWPASVELDLNPVRRSSSAPREEGKQRNRRRNAHEL